jgi:hypothetical protein
VTVASLEQGFNMLADWIALFSQEGLHAAMPSTGYPVTGTIAGTNYRLIGSIIVAAGSEKNVRIYFKDGTSGGLVITRNAIAGSSWSADNTATPAVIMLIGSDNLNTALSGGFVMGLRQVTTGTWTDSGWTQRFVVSSALAAGTVRTQLIGELGGAVQPDPNGALRGSFILGYLGLEQVNAAHITASVALDQTSTKSGSLAAVDTTGGAVTVTLYDGFALGANLGGGIVIVKDVGGMALVNNITIAVPTGGSMDGVLNGTKTISTNFASLRFFNEVALGTPAGKNWFTW